MLLPKNNQSPRHCQVTQNKTLRAMLLGLNTSRRQSICHKCEFVNINTDFNVKWLLTKSLYNPAIDDPNVNNPCLKCGEPSLHLLHGARVNFLSDSIIIRYIFIISPPSWWWGSPWRAPGPSCTSPSPSWRRSAARTACQSWPGVVDSCRYVQISVDIYSHLVSVHRVSHHRHLVIEVLEKRSKISHHEVICIIYETGEKINPTADRYPPHTWCSSYSSLCLASSVLILCFIWFVRQIIWSLSRTLSPRATEQKMKRPRAYTSQLFLVLRRW